MECVQKGVEVLNTVVGMVERKGGDGEGLKKGRGREVTKTQLKEVKEVKISKQEK